MSIIEEKIIKVTGNVKIREYSKSGILGEGKSSKCYEFTCLKNKVMFAGKVINKEKMVESIGNQNLIREIKIHKALNHPNIVTLECYFEESENFYK